jgi:hypothetical protein
MNENRLRSALEIATAILLGLVSIATAAGAYQASSWAQDAGRYSAASGQLRDLSLSSFIASQLAGFDDGERMFDALVIEFEIMEAEPGSDLDDLRDQSDVILAGASPGLLDDWAAWVESGYAQDDFPGTGVDYQSDLYAPTFSANRASAVAADLADQLGARSLQQTVAAVIFALALLLLGVSGANASLKVSFALAVGGACAFLVGVVISALAAIG